MPPDIDQARLLNSVMPAQEPIRICTRGAYGATEGLTAIACRHPATREDFLEFGNLMGSTMIRWQILNADLVGPVKVGDVIIDGAGVTYNVRKVDILWLSTVKDCLAIQDVTVCS